MMTTRLQSRKMRRTCFDEVAKVVTESDAKIEEVIEMTPTASGALQPEAQSAFQMLEIAISKYFFVENTSFNRLKDLEKLETNSALRHSVNMVLVDPAYGTRSARSQAGFAHDSFVKRTSRTLCSSRPA